MAILEQIAAALQTGTPGQALGISTAQTIEPITPSGSGPSPSSSTPASIGAPAVGVSLDYARADHAHGGALADLSDVASTAPTPGQVLAWGGSEWAPATPAASPSPSSSTPASIGAPAVGVSLDYARADHAHGGALADLSDVAATPPTSGQVLAWSGSEWAPATASSGGPWQEAAGIISPTNPGSVAQVDVTGGAVGVTVADTGAAFASRIAAGAISAVDTGGVIFAALSAVGEASLSLRGDTGGPTIPKIVATDFDASPAALDLQILDLQINGAAGTAGDVLTSNGPGVAPTWQPAAGGGIAYIDHTINLTTTNSVAGQYVQDHQVAGLDPSVAYLMDLAEFDNYTGGINQIGLLACTKAPATPTSSIATTEQQAAILGTFSAPASISSLPILDGTTGTVIGPRAGFTGSPVAPAVVTTDTAGRLNLRGVTNVNGGGFRVKIRLRKVSP